MSRMLNLELNEIVLVEQQLESLETRAQLGILPPDYEGESRIDLGDYQSSSTSSFPLLKAFTGELVTDQINQAGIEARRQIAIDEKGRRVKQKLNMLIGESSSITTNGQSNTTDVDYDDYDDTSSRKYR